MKEWLIITIYYILYLRPLIWLQKQKNVSMLTKYPIVMTVDNLDPLLYYMDFSNSNKWTNTTIIARIKIDTTKNITVQNEKKKFGV